MTNLFISDHMKNENKHPLLKETVAIPYGYYKRIYAYVVLCMHACTYAYYTAVFNLSIYSLVL